MHDGLNPFVPDTARPRSDFVAYGEHVNPTLSEFLWITSRAQEFVRAAGNTLTSRDGRVYKDWIAGFGSLNLGHNPPAPLDALRAFADAGEPNLFIEAINPAAGALARRLVQAAGPRFETCFFSNSGSEAVEAAVKLAVAATGRSRIVYCGGGYHGTTLGALAMMAPGVFRAPFEPVVPQWQCVPFNDAAALEKVFKNNDMAALVVEPIQVESGVRQASGEFLQAARACCDRSGALLVLDEVQTGLGRTGAAFAFEQCGVTPDVIALAKALGAGVVPIGATLARKGLFQRAYGSYERCEAHNSTYGGNALACSVALAAVDAMLQPALLANARVLGETLDKLCNEHLRDHALVKAWRFHGLLGAIEMHDTTHPWFDWAALGMPEWRDKPSTGALLVHRLHRRGFLLQLCGHDWNCLRIEPPLNINETDCRDLVAAVRAELDWIASHG